MDPYALLELEPGASGDEIKKAWRRLARRHHPDLNPDDPDAAARFQAIQEAYEALTSGRAAAPSASDGPLPDPDWVDSVRWMAEVRRQEVMRDILPRFVAAYGTRSALVWALRAATDLQRVAAALPAHRPQRFVRRLPLDLFVDEEPDAWRMAALHRQASGRIALVLYAAPLWRQRPPDEDGLRTLVFSAVDHGIAAAVAAAMRRELVPPTLEAAQANDRREVAQDRLWRAVWLGIALFVVVVVWAMVADGAAPAGP